MRNFKLLACLLCFASASCHAALTDDLVGLYDFENNFLDSSGSPRANHGTPVNGPGFTPGKIGTAVSLTGVRDYVSFDPLSLTDFDFGNTDNGSAVDFTMSAWIRQDDFLSDPAVLSNKDWNSGNNTGIAWAPKGNGVFDLNTKGSSGARRDLDTLTNSFPLTVGEWNLVVMSVDRDGPTELYINGVNRGTIPLTSTGSFNGGLPWNLGQDGTGNYSVEFTGAVDEFAVWRRAISSEEADQLWNDGAGLTLADQIVETRLKLVINRETGAMTIENNTGVDQDLIGYQVISSAGAFDQTYWNPIAGRLDATGNGTIDNDDPWLVGSPPDSVAELIELSLGTGTLPAGESIELGNAVWRKFYREQDDLDFQYADGIGDEPLLGIVSFVSGPDGPLSFPLGDLNFDGALDSEDWLRLQSGFGTDLSGLSEAQRYRAADLDDDLLHTLADIQIFRQSFDSANGAGAFQAMLAQVPEPSSLLLLAVPVACLVAQRRSWRAQMVLLAFLLTCGGSEPCEAASLFFEDFDSVALGPSVDEQVTGSNVWSSTPPVGWMVDNSSMPGGGVTEWRGWSFADPEWWATTAEDQQRSDFTKASGAVAVADPDEWDDVARDPGFFHSLLTTPSIPLSGIPSGSIRLRFDSSWRPEDTQTATIRANYSNGSSSELLQWTSVGGDPNFKADATNETVEVGIDHPAGASSMTLEFVMSEAGNDWWWAIDNVEVFAPLTLQVNTDTGAMQILGDATVALSGYEISSPENSLAPAGWLAGNLDAQNIGASLPAAADFNGSGTVDATDLAAWETAYGATGTADSDEDGDSDGEDFLRWQRQNGDDSDAASTWLSFLATDSQLIESYLLGSSTFATDVSLGAGYNTTLDRRDLEFVYLTPDNEEVVGLVRYVSSQGALATVPEPTSVVLALLGAAWGSCFHRGRR